MLAGTLAMALLGIFLFFIISVLEKLFCPWTSAQVKV
jgi:ABC-type nitrate/sulfonate/bicarbonate transport system permease component